MRYTKLLLRPFLGGILFGLFLGLFLWYMFDSFVIGMLFWLAIGGIFGFSLALYNYVMIKRLTKKYGNYEWLKTHHEREIVLSMPYDDAFNLCLEVVKTLKRCKIQEENRRTGKITAMRRPKIPSWRYVDLITVELRRIDENKTSVKISSRPMYYRALDIDFGSNLENVEEILSSLKKYVMIF